MDIFYDFVNKNYEGYTLENYSNKLNSRNISKISSVINSNLKKIYLVKKRATNSIIFRNLNYPKHLYLFLNGEKVFALEDTNIEPHIQKFDDFLGYKRVKPKIENDMPFDPDKDGDRKASKEEIEKVLNKLKNLSSNMEDQIKDIKEQDEISNKIDEAKDTLNTALEKLDNETEPEISDEIREKFIQSDAFIGSKDGFKFQMGPLGLGYYPDNKITIE